MIDFLIKEKFNIEKIRLLSAVLKKEDGVLYLTFLTDRRLDDDLQKDILMFCKEKLKVQSVAAKFKHSIYDDEAALYVVESFIKENFSNVYSMLENGDVKVSKLDDCVKVELVVIEDFISILEKNQFVKCLKDKLAEFYFENFDVVFKAKQTKSEDLILEEMERRRMTAKIEPKEESVVRLKVSDVSPLIGDVVNKPPIALTSVKEPADDVYVCGTVHFFNKRTYKKKQKDGSVEDKEYFSFMIDDGTGKINCTYFPTKATLAKMEKIVDETKIVSFGRVESFNGRLSFRPKDISLCLGFEPIEKKIEFKGVPDDYSVVFPQEFKRERQLNLLGEDVSGTSGVSGYLADHKFVVFDLETTGLNFDRDEIIEIGACLVENGEITKTFSTLIKPSIPIPEESTKVNHITDEMVKDAPTFDRVVGDFYKFCDGAIMVAYNAGFDKTFLDNNAEKCFYKFNNKIVDAMVVASEKIKGLKNYKLKTVLERLGIENECAHRGTEDAVATAKAFIELMKNE